LYNDAVAGLTQLISEHPTYKVVVTGHSLGGCEASLTMFLLKLDNVFPDTQFELYTYGAPRVGNRGFAKFMNSLDIPIARIVHGSDLAAHYLTPFSLGYVHHQNEVWEVRDGVVWKNCSRKVYEDLACSNSQAPVLAQSSQHTTYFGRDAWDCLTEDPIAGVLQVIVDLNPLVPPAVKKTLQEMVSAAPEGIVGI